MGETHRIFCDNCKLVEDEDGLIKITVAWLTKEQGDEEKLFVRPPVMFSPFLGLAQTQSPVEKVTIDVCYKCFHEIPILRQINLKGFKHYGTYGKFQKTEEK